MWLTQRIANRLVEALVKRVEPEHSDTTYVEVMSAISQRQAEATREPSAPVKVASPDYEWLVAKIDLALPRSGVVLTFSDAVDQTARISMNNQLVRQWLSILRTNYIVAGWDTREWPEWITPTASLKPRGTVIH